jgi:hypothetical protein
MVAAHPIALPCLGEFIQVIERFPTRQRYSGVVVGVIHALPSSRLLPAVILQCSDGSLTDWLHVDDCVYCLQGGKSVTLE